jgi:hypothetical protein
MNATMQTRMTSFAAIAGLLLAPLTAVAATDNGTMTVGWTDGGPNCDGGLYARYIIGFYGGVLGSYSPTSLTGGKTVFSISENIDMVCAFSASGITVSGFTASPGSSWLSSITCNGNTLSSGAAIFSYDSSTGRASWLWMGGSFGFGSIPNGTSTSCSITHN